MKPMQKIQRFFFIFCTIILSILCIVMIGHREIFAATETVFTGGGLQEGAKIVQENIQGTGLVEEGSLVDTLIWGIKWLLILSGILAFIAFLYAGFLYITTYFNDGNPETAKNAMINAAIGILIIVFSYVIVNFLTTLEFS